MSSMSDYLENQLIDFIFRGQSFTPPAHLYIGLVTVNEDDAASGGTEVSGNNYSRVDLPPSLTNWAGTQGAGSTSASSGTSGTTSNNVAINFPTPSGTGWGTVVGVGVWDASTGGNLLFYNPLSASKSVPSGAVVSYAAGALTVQIDN